MASRYPHKDNVGFYERDIFAEKDYNCPNPGQSDNRHQAFIYAYLLAAGTFDTWKCGADGEYVPHDHSPKHLNEIAPAIMAKHSASAFRMIRDLIRHKETPFSEVQAVKLILSFLGEGTGWIHQDPDVLAYENQLPLSGLVPYAYLTRAPHLSKRKRLLKQIAAKGYLDTYLDCQGNFWPAK